MQDVLLVFTAFVVAMRGEFERFLLSQIVLTKSTQTAYAPLESQRPQKETPKTH
jgi:hypothetical protein